MSLSFSWLRSSIAPSKNHKLTHDHTHALANSQTAKVVFRNLQKNIYQSHRLRENVAIGSFGFRKNVCRRRSANRSFSNSWRDRCRNQKSNPQQTDIAIAVRVANVNVNVTAIVHDAISIRATATIVNSNVVGHTTTTRVFIAAIDAATLFVETLRENAGIDRVDFLAIRSESVVAALFEIV